jgi:hypothetical protein
LTHSCLKAKKVPTIFRRLRLQNFWSVHIRRSEPNCENGPFNCIKTGFRHLVSSFTEVDGAQLAALISELKRKGQQMKFFDAGIAATVLARGDKLLVLDSDFDRLTDRIKLLRPPL